MIIGTLLEVMCLDEDALKANRRRVINRAMNDPNTRVGLVYDGTKQDLKNQYSQLIKLKTDKQKGLRNASWADFCKENNYNPPPAPKPKPQPPKIKRDANTRASFMSIGNNDFYAVNKYAAPDLVQKNGMINWNNSTMDHETQHNIQQNVLKKIGKQNGIGTNEVIKRWNNYDKNLSSDPAASYRKSPAEFEANIAGQNRNPQATMGTYRIANQILGKSTPQKEFIPSYTHGLLQSQRSLKQSNPNQTEMNLSKRNYENKMYERDLRSGDLKDRTPQQANKNMNANRYNQRGQQIINSIKTPTRTFQLDQLNNVKGMSNNSSINKSKNNFVKIRNTQGKTITVPDTDPRYIAQIQKQRTQQAIKTLGTTNAVADRNTGIVYAKKNGKLVSNMMTASQQK